MTDRIERDIHVDAPIARVWALVSRPGWFIGDGDRSGHTVTTDGDHVIVDDPRYGRFPLLVVASEEPGHVAYRGSAVEGRFPAEGASTLVEFFLTEEDGGTRLRVVESGFDSLDLTDAERAAAIEGNIKGWEFQLDVARRELSS